MASPENMGGHKDTTDIIACLSDLHISQFDSPEDFMRSYEALMAAGVEQPVEKVVIPDQETDDETIQFAAPEVVLNPGEVTSAVNHIENILRCMRTLVTIGDYYTFALFDLGNSLKAYAREVEERGWANPNHNLGDESHLIRSRCIAESAQFWDRIAQVNDGARMKLLREFFKFNRGANGFFQMHASMHRTPAPGCGDNPPTGSISGPGAPMVQPARLFGRPGGVPDSERDKSCAFVGLPGYSFMTPDSAVYPTLATHPFRPAADESDEESRIRIDTSFRTLEDGFLRSFVIEGTMGGSRKLGEATEEINKMGFSGLKDCAAILDIDLSCKLAESERASSRSPSPEDLLGEIHRSRLPESHGRQSVRMPMHQNSNDPLDSCPFLRNLRNKPGLKVSDHQLLAELVAKTDMNKENKGYSSKAPFPSSIQEIVNQNSVVTSLTSSDGFKNMEESTRPTSVQDQYEGKSAGMVRFKSSENDQEDIQGFIRTAPSHCSALQNAWSRTRVDGQLDVIPEEAKAVEETPVGKDLKILTGDTAEKTSVSTDQHSSVDADKGSENIEELPPQKRIRKVRFAIENDESDDSSNSSAGTEQLFPHMSEASISERDHRPKSNRKKPTVASRVTGSSLTRTGNFCYLKDGTLKLTAPRMRNSKWGPKKDIRNSNDGAHVRTETLPSSPNTEFDFSSVQARLYDITDMSAVASFMKDSSFCPQSFVQIDSSELI